MHTANGQPRESDRRVLMIAHAFPPTGGPGVQRPAKFAKYLSRMGWQPVVWSADSVAGLPRDESLANDLPEHVERFELASRGPMDVVAGWAASAARVAGRSPRAARWSDGAAWRLRRLGRWVAARGVPDDRLVWAIRSCRRLLRICRTRPFDVIFSTYSPPSNHLVAWLLKRATGIPWVADFRDLWTDDCRYAGGWAVRRWLDRRIEDRFLEDADAVTCVSEPQTRILADHLPAINRHKFHTITNGVDFEEFDHAATRATPRRDDVFTLTHVGQVSSARFTDDYFAGIARFLDNDAQRRRRFAFRLVGVVSPAIAARSCAANVGLETTGYVSHADAIGEMRAAHVLLLPTALGANSASLMPGKVFEYLASGRPILVVGDEDAAPAKLVRAMNAGVVVRRNAERIALALERYWQMFHAGRLPAGATREQLAGFGRERLTARLADLFDRVIGEANGHRSAAREDITCSNGGVDTGKSATNTTITEAIAR